MSSRSSRSESGQPLPETVTVGRVRKPHGVRGALLVEVFSDVEGRFAVGSRVDLVLSSGVRRPVRIVQASRGDRAAARVRFEGIETRDQADELRDALLEVDRQQSPPAPDGSYYFFELVGCVCCDRQRGVLGRIEDVLEDGGGLLLEVRQGRRVVLIPFVRSYVRRVDVERRYLEVELPEGLIESCAWKS